jgi:hypothetical protein
MEDKKCDKGRTEGCGQTNLFKKLHAVLVDLRRLPKDKRNPQGRYEYASERVIKEFAHQSFEKNGILLLLSAIDVDTMTLANSSGQVLVTKTKFKYTFVDIDSGEKFEGTFFGTGNGRDDKGYYASVTGALKYIITSTFMIPTGDDPEDGRFDLKPETTRIELVNKVVEKRKAKAEPKKEPVKKKIEEKPVEKEVKEKPKPITPEVKEPVVKKKDDPLEPVSKEDANKIIKVFEAVGITRADIENYISEDCYCMSKINKNLLKKAYNAIRSPSIKYTVAQFKEGDIYFG